MYRSADRFYLENIVEVCVNIPIWENLTTKSTKVARLGIFKKKSNEFSHFGKFIDKLNKICYNVNNKIVHTDEIIVRWL